MILFLDFDGVLHPFPLTPTSDYFSATAPLWKILERIPDLSVVITSTWRERFSLSQLIELLVEHGGAAFKSRFVGITPVLENATDYVAGIRQREIELWLVQNRLEHECYLILDDIEEYFDLSCSNLYLVDGVTGLTQQDAEIIPLWIDALS